MPRGAPRPEPNYQQDHPEFPGLVVLCNRCKQHFVCKKPELSGVVQCPVCSETASLSSAHADRVRLAATELIRHGAYNDRFSPLGNASARVAAMDPATREKLAGCAVKFREGALETCPACLYDLAGTLEGDKESLCPECGIQVSRPIHAMIWGERAIAARRSCLLAFLSAPALGAWYIIHALLIVSFSSDFEVLESLLSALLLVNLLVTVALPFGVAAAAYHWLMLRDPKMLGGVALLLATLIACLSVGVLIVAFTIAFGIGLNG